MHQDLPEQITKQEVIDWKQNRVTKRLFERMNEIREQVFNVLCSGTTFERDHQTAHEIGKMAAITIILSEVERLQDDDEEERGSE